MIGLLARICEAGGWLVGVSSTVAVNDPSVVTTVALRFEEILLEAARRANWDAARSPRHLRSGRFHTEDAA